MTPVGPGRFCSPRHRSWTPCNSISEGSNAWDEVASDIWLALDAGDGLTNRERATAAAADHPMLFDFEALPDEVAGAVLRKMGDYEVAATACASKRFRRLTDTDDALWGG